MLTNLEMFPLLKTNKIINTRYSKFTALALFNVAIIVGFLLVVGKEIDFNSTQQTIVNLDLTNSLLIFSIKIVTVALYGIRLTLITPVSFGKAWCSCAVALACNNILPFRLGEGVRVAFTKIYLKISIKNIVFFMIIEKFIDLIALASLLIFVLFFHPYFESVNIFNKPKHILYVTTFIGTIAFAVYISWSHTLQIRKKVYCFVDTWYQQHLQENITSLKMNFFKLTFVSLVLWMLTILLVNLFFSKYIAQFSILDAVCLTVLIALSIAISTTPINLGTFEVIVAGYLMKTFALLPADAIGLALAFHILIVLPYFVSVPILTFRCSSMFKLP